MIKIKRVYEPVDEDDGYRILVDRLWPRGLSKDAASVDLWLKDIAPTTDLRTWFGHDPAKWSEFRRRYKRELERNVESLAEIHTLMKQHQVITLLYASKDDQHNQAVVLQEFLH